MKKFIIFLFAVLLGAAAGLALTMYGPGGVSKVKIGIWQSDWSIGSRDAGPYVRAHVARFGLLALTKEEAVYFIAKQDSQGRPLTERCAYEVSGGKMPAQWWSVTIYDHLGYLGRNNAQAHSYDATAAPVANDWRFRVSKHPPSEGAATAWVSSENTGKFDLTLRLYRPDAALLSTPQTALTPPVITRMECENV